MLKRNFKFSGPNEAWVGDITCIPTGEGWPCDCQGSVPEKGGWVAFGDRIDTGLTLAALEMAVRNQKPKPDLIFHSDRSLQYASTAYRQALEYYEFRQSMSRKGDPYDNAVAENFFSCLKCECVYLHFPTRNAAKTSAFRYIEAFYNSVRPHSGIGWLAPNTFERLLLVRSALHLHNIA